MNIQILTPKFLKNQNNLNPEPNSTIRRSNLNSLNANTAPNLRPLAKDTVSFTANPNKTVGIFNDAIEQAYFTNEEKFISIARNFHKTLKKVCEKLAPYGFSYDDAYNLKHPIKTLESFVDKYRRQGYVQDIVRGTVYWPNQHDIPAFKMFVDAMAEEGYKISKVKQYNYKTKKFDKVPDLEIRQNGISSEDLNILEPFLRKADISKPRGSSYSDYQMRFSTNKSSIDMETLLIYGPHYAKAKEIESKYIFNISRAFNKLHVDLSQNYLEKTPGRRIANNIDVIKTRLREDVSKPLFTNAFNADLKIKGEQKLPVSISKTHAAMLDGYMSGIRQKLPLYYKDMKKQIKSDEYIKNLIEKSISYKMREQKVITKEEIIATRERLKALLPIYQAEDIGTIATAQQLLKQVISKFGEK